MLIVVGHPRSGTTMLARALNSHPDIVVTFEFQCLENLDVGFQEHKSGLRMGILARRLVELSPRQPQHAEGSRLISRWKNGLLDRAASVVFLQKYLREIHTGGIVRSEDVERALRRASGNPIVVGDKFPEYVFELDRLAQLDNAQILAIGRDPRDVVASALSMYRSGWSGGKLGSSMGRADQAAASWLKASEAIESHSSRVHRLSYEEFVREPSSTMAEIAHWLGVDPGGFSVKGISERSIGRFGDRLSSDELASIIAVAGTKMEEMGYL